MPFLVPLVLAGCASDELTSIDDDLTAVIPASDTCSQGLGASWCVQTPTFIEKGAPTHRVDGTNSFHEYAGALAVPFTTDDTTGATVQGSGTVFIQRVTSQAAANDVFVFLQDIPVKVHDTAQPVKSAAQVEIYIDYNRFTGTTKLPQAEDRRYTIDLNGTLSGHTQVVIDQGNGASWVPAVLSPFDPPSATFAPAGCKLVKAGIATCSGELRLTVGASGIKPPATGLFPGIGFEVRGVSEIGTGPELPTTRYATMSTDVTAWQTILFGRPRGFQLSFMTWNVRRFEKPWEDEGFDAVDPGAIGQFLANNDVVALQEGWDPVQVGKILAGANAARATKQLPLYSLIGPIDYDPATSELLRKIAYDVDYTEGGVWLMTWLPVADRGYHVYSTDACRGEDCLKAKGVLWARLWLQDPAKYSPVCLKDHPATGCTQVPSGDDFIDVFATHLNASDPELCKSPDEWSAMKWVLVSASAGLAALNQPWLAATLASVQVLTDTDLHCSGLTDIDARALQLGEMNSFITAKAATDRASIVMGDFNVDGKTETGEYGSTLVNLGISPALAPTSDLVSSLPNGPDIQNGDIIREQGVGVDITDGVGKCAGTFIADTRGTLDPSCPTFTSKVDGELRLDYILVRPPAPPAQAQDPRWIVEGQVGQQLWASPFPTNLTSFSSVPMIPDRLSDHKPVVAKFEIARLQNPPLYHPRWRHTTEQRIVGVDATGFDDCWLCGEVDPTSVLDTTMLPTNQHAAVVGAECEDDQAPSAGDPCLANWFLVTPHDPLITSSVSMHAIVTDDDNTSGNDTLSEGTRDALTYADGMWSFHHSLGGVESTEGQSWPMTEQAAMGRCGGVGATVCHQITVTPVPLGQ